MSALPPLDLLLAADPDVPGMGALLARADAERRKGVRIRDLLTGAGLGWREDGALRQLGSHADVDVSLCSRSVREQGLHADALPKWIRWSSLVRWLLERPADGRLWGGLP